MTPETRPARDQRAPWGLIGVLAVLFCALAVAAGMIGTLPGDERVTDIVQRTHGWGVEVIWRLGNAIGSTVPVIGLFALILGMTIYARWQRDIWFLMIVLVSRILTMPLKGIITSPRPTSEQATTHEVFAGYGFPSGHTLTSTILLGSVAFLMVRHLTGRWVTPVAVAIWVLGVLATAFARVWLGAHWASDVLGGAVLGITIVLIAVNGSAWLVERRARMSFVNPETGSDRLSDT